MCTSNSWKTSTPTARWQHSTYTKNATRWKSYRLSCLWQHMATNNLHDEMQSVYRQHHSTKLVKVWHDIVHILVSGRCAILLLLDSSAASATINIDKLINNLVSRVKIDNVARDWFIFVTIGSSCSNTILIYHGLLRPEMFKEFTAPIADICTKHLVLFHRFADDIQLYVIYNSAVSDELSHTK